LIKDLRTLIRGLRIMNKRFEEMNKRFEDIRYYIDRRIGLREINCWI